MNEKEKQILTEIALAIREAGRIPSGHLYASLMGSMGLVKYNAMIETLKNAGLIKVTGMHEIIYTGEI